MSQAVLASLEAHSLTAGEISDLREVISKNEDSKLAVLLGRIIDASQNGVDINLLSSEAEFSPNQASELLKMSRPHLLKFMDRGELPFHTVGTHKRIKMSDLLQFMEAREAGAEILANAVYAPSKRFADPVLSNDALRELNDL